MSIIERNWPTLSAFVEAARKCHEKVRYQSYSNWAGGTRDEALELATNGWADGVARAAEQTNKLAARLVQAPALMVMRHELTNDVVGCAYDPGAFSSGAPECWSLFSPEESKRGVRIVANICVSADIPRHVMEARGVAVCALAMVLQGAGYPVTIDVMTSMKIPNKTSERFLVRIADANSGSPLDIDRIVYALGHPTMLRQLAFTVLGGGGNVAWGDDGAGGDAKPEGDIDIYLGRAHLSEVERWQDGGESWILSEYMRQTMENT